MGGAVAPVEDVRSVLQSAEDQKNDWWRGFKKQIGKDSKRVWNKVNDKITPIRKKYIKFKTSQYIKEEEEEFAKLQKARKIPEIKEQWKKQSSLFDHLDQPRQKALQQLMTDEGFGRGNVKGEIGYGKEGFRYKDTKGIHSYITEIRIFTQH